MKVHIPETIEALRQSLGGLEQLLFATQWERAAIVYAWTDPVGGSDTNPPLTIKAFARLDIRGVKTPPDVRAYRKAWEGGGGDLSVSPGSDVELPDAEWKDHYGESTPDVQKRVFRAVVRDPKLFKEALDDEPEDLAQLARQVVDTPTIREAVEERLAKAPSRDHVRSSINEAMDEWRRDNAWRATMEAFKYVTPLYRFSPEDVARDTPADDWEHTRDSLERAAELFSSFAARLGESRLREVR